MYRLLKAMYGLRDAGASFDRVVTLSLGDLGFREGAFSPYLATNAPQNRKDGVSGDPPTDVVRLTRHGDDFVALGTRSANKRFESGLSRHLIVKHQGTFGPRKELGDVQEVSHLNRIVRWCLGGTRRVELEPDPRHVEILVRQAGLQEGAKGVTTPGLRPAATESGQAPPSAALPPEEASLYRSMTMRAAYLGMDRADIQYAAKELARSMSQPTRDSFASLKRLVRYLLHRPPVCVIFVRQPAVRWLDGRSDSDWAGCPRTRKSTSSSCLTLGSHLLCSSSTTQTVVATSSEDAKFYAAAKTASRLLGAAAMAEDLSVHLAPRLLVDANAAKGIASRRGVGKVRHLHVATLWLQQVVAEKRLWISKLPGDRNMADLRTEHVPAPVLETLMRLMGLEVREGRSALAFRAAEAT